MSSHFKHLLQQFQPLLSQLTPRSQHKSGGGVKERVLANVSNVTVTSESNLFCLSRQKKLASYKKKSFRNEDYAGTGSTLDTPPTSSASSSTTTSSSSLNSCGTDTQVTTSQTPLPMVDSGLDSSLTTVTTACYSSSNEHSSDSHKSSGETYSFDSDRYCCDCSRRANRRADIEIKLMLAYERLRQAKRAESMEKCYANLPLMVAKSFRPSKLKATSPELKQIDVKKGTAVNALYMRDSKWIFVKTVTEEMGFIPKKCCEPFVSKLDCKQPCCYKPAAKPRPPIAQINEPLPKTPRETLAERQPDKSVFDHTYMTITDENCNLVKQPAAATECVYGRMSEYKASDRIDLSLLQVSSCQEETSTESRTRIRQRRQVRSNSQKRLKMRSRNRKYSLALNDISSSLTLTMLEQQQQQQQSELNSTRHEARPAESHSRARRHLALDATAASSGKKSRKIYRESVEEVPCKKSRTQAQPLQCHLAPGRCSQLPVCRAKDFRLITPIKEENELIYVNEASRFNDAVPQAAANTYESLSSFESLESLKSAGVREATEPNQYGCLGSPVANHYDVLMNCNSKQVASRAAKRSTKQKSEENIYCNNLVNDLGDEDSALAAEPVPVPEDAVNSSLTRNLLEVISDYKSNFKGDLTIRKGDLVYSVESTSTKNENFYEELFAASANKFDSDWCFVRLFKRTSRQLRSPSERQTIQGFVPRCCLKRHPASDYANLSQ